MSAAVDQAYSKLRERILSGQLSSGDRLKERELCAELKVSRTPVREALRRLEAEGLVNIEARRGAVVAGLGVAEANEIYSLGIVLESFAARLAASCANAEDLARLDEILTRMEQVLSEDAPAARIAYLELDSELHHQIVKITGNRRLDSIVRQIVGIPVLAQAFNHYSYADLRNSLQQHRNIVTALHAGDPDWAEAAMQSHIRTGRALMVSDAFSTSKPQID